MLSYHPVCIIVAQMRVYAKSAEATRAGGLSATAMPSRVRKHDRMPDTPLAGIRAQCGTLNRPVWLNRQNGLIAYPRGQHTLGISLTRGHTLFRSRLGGPLRCADAVSRGAASHARCIWDAEDINVFPFQGLCHSPAPKASTSFTLLPEHGTLQL